MKKDYLFKLPVKAQRRIFIFAFLLLILLSGCSEDLHVTPYYDIEVHNDCKQGTIGYTAQNGEYIYPYFIKSRFYYQGVYQEGMEIELYLETANMTGSITIN